MSIEKSEWGVRGGGRRRWNRARRKGGGHGDSSSSVVISLTLSALSRISFLPLFCCCAAGTGIGERRGRRCCHLSRQIYPPRQPLTPRSWTIFSSSSLEDLQEHIQFLSSSCILFFCQRLLILFCLGAIFSLSAISWRGRCI
jgi:hypothetical protein